MAGIYYEDKFICGGSIISNNFILTAGHCVADKFVEYLSVRTGTTFNDVNQLVTIHRNLRIILHENFTLQEFRSDIALIQLAEPIELNEKQKAIRLAKPDKRYKPGSKVVITGWGTLEFLSLSTVLRKIMVPIVKEARCKLLHRLFGGIVKEDEFCAGTYLTLNDELTGDHLREDCGSPVIQDRRQIGVVSCSQEVPGFEYPGVHVKIAYYRDWINKYSDVLTFEPTCTKSICYKNRNTFFSWFG